MNGREEGRQTMIRMLEVEAGRSVRRGLIGYVITINCMIEGVEAFHHRLFLFLFASSHLRSIHLLRDPSPLKALSRP